MSVKAVGFVGSQEDIIGAEPTLDERQVNGVRLQRLQATRPPLQELRLGEVSLAQAKALLENVERGHYLMVIDGPTPSDEAPLLFLDRAAYPNETRDPRLLAAHATAMQCLRERVARLSPRAVAAPAAVAIAEPDLRELARREPPPAPAPARALVEPRPRPLRAAETIDDFTRRDALASVRGREVKTPKRGEPELLERFSAYHALRSELVAALATAPSSERRKVLTSGVHQLDIGAGLLTKKHGDSSAREARMDQSLGDACEALGRDRDAWRPIEVPAPRPPVKIDESVLPP